MYSALRLLFSRIGEPSIGPASFFSFNNPNGMCKTCAGIGKVMEFDVHKMIEVDKTYDEGFFLLPAFGPGKYYWKAYRKPEYFRTDVAWKDLSEREQKDTTLKKIGQFMYECECVDCKGKRLNDEALSCKINGYNIADMCEMEFSTLREELGKIDDKRATSIVGKLADSLDRMIDIGLPYLSMNRESSKK